MLSAGSFGGFACLGQGCGKAEPDLSGVKGRVSVPAGCWANTTPRVEQGSCTSSASLFMQ